MRIKTLVGRRAAAYSDTGSAGRAVPAAAAGAGRGGGRAARRRGAAQAACALRRGGACGSWASSSRRPRPTEARRCSSAHPPLLRMLRSPASLAALGAQLVLCRHRQFVDARHARPATGRPLRRGRDEGARRRRLEGLRLAAAGSGNSDGFGCDRPDRHVLDRGDRQHCRRHRRLRGRLRSPPGRARSRGGGVPARPPLRALDPLGHALLVGAQLLRQLGKPQLGLPRLRCRPRCCGGVVDAGRHHRDADDAVEGLVEGGADDDVGVLVDLLADAGGGLVDLVEREVACRR